MVLRVLNLVSKTWGEFIFVEFCDEKSIKFKKRYCKIIKHIVKCVGNLFRKFFQDLNSGYFIEKRIIKKFNIKIYKMTNVTRNLL